MICEKWLSGADYLIIVLELVIILYFLTLFDILCGDVEVIRTNISLGEVGTTGMVKQRQRA